MNKKKIISLLLTCLLVTYPTLTAVALDKTTPYKAAPSLDSYKIIALSESKVKLTKENAVQQSKSLLENYFDILVNDKDFKCTTTLDSLYYSESSSDRRVWNISWFYRAYQKEINISISLDANDGKLIYMNKSEYGVNTTSSIPTISSEEAKKIAEKTINKINPEEYKNSKLSEDRWFSNRGNSSNYNFSYVRVINGASYENNNIYINVDGTTGKVTAYNCNWDYNLSIPEKEKYIDLIDAQAIFKNDMGMVLKYKLFTNKYEYQNIDDKKNVKLVYEPKLASGTVIDAVNGKFITYDYTKNTETVSLNEKETAAFYEKYKSLQDSAAPLSEVEALASIKSIVNSIYGPGYSINNIRYSEDTKKIWTAYFTKKIDDKITQDGSISINALNGQIIYINNYSPYDYTEKFIPKYTWKEGYTKAIDALGNYYSDKIKDINLTLINEQIQYAKYQQEPERFYRYVFSRKVNNIPFEDNNIYIEFNAKTGEISSVHCLWDENISFQSPKTNIGVEKSKDSYSSKYVPTLNYTLKNDITNSTSPSKAELDLVYIFPYNSIYVDAFDGKILNSYDGEEIKFDIADFLNEIKNSKFEKEIKILAYKGLIDTNSFKLNAEVKNINLIKTLVDALGYTPYIVSEKSSLDSTADTKGDGVGSLNTTPLSDEDYVKMAKYYGIVVDNIEDFKGDAQVSKEEMCKALIKFLQYDNIAQASDMFTLNFKDSKDVSKDNIGYVALAKGLNLVTLDGDNNLKPTKIITNEDLALGIFKALQLKQVNNNRYPFPLYKN